MSKIREAFEKGKAFIPFITCGDPDLETTAAVVRAAAANGADLIELGIPFSDPTAEGPVIQGANIRALEGGVTTDKVFAAEGCDHPYGIHDLCQRGIFLWGGEIHLYLPGNRHGWIDLAGYSL